MSYEKRQNEALIPHWENVIPLDLRKQFLSAETVYCAEASKKFRSCEDADRERLRTIVLEQRKEFLQLYCKHIVNKV